MNLTYELHQDDGEFSIHLGRDRDNQPIYFPLDGELVDKSTTTPNVACKYHYRGTLYMLTEKDFREFVKEAKSSPQK